MAEMIRVDNVSLAELSAPTSFVVNGGDMCVLLTPKEEDSIYLTRLLIGQEQARSGHVFLFGVDLAALSARELREARRKTGIAYGSGGLVSNLKAWENITLPLYYHQHLTHAEIEERGLAVLERLGYKGDLMALPGHLTIRQKKLIGLARAILTDPDVMMYESPASGLNHEDKNRFFTIAREFHYEKPDRASLFITSNPEVARYVPEAVVVNLTEGQFL
jgi:phospholipid/cholesterol/gamma-HCH transport system ATP-binding protein